MSPTNTRCVRVTATYRSRFPGRNEMGTGLREQR
jgi:hypothetical protein